MSAPLPPEVASLTHRLTEIPRRGGAEESPVNQRLFSALAACHAHETSVAIAWLRPRPDGPVQVLVGGPPSGNPKGSTVPVRYPDGALGRPLGAGTADVLLSTMTWSRLELALATGTAAAQSSADSLEDLFGRGVEEPCGIVVVARPLGPIEAGVEMERLSDELAKLEGLRSGRGVHRRKLAHAEEDLKYYEQWSGSGLWQLAILTGGATERGSRAVAGMVAGSADVATSPLLLRASALGGMEQYDWSDTCVVGSDAVAALARPPFDEIPGVRVASVPKFDQNVEDQVDVRLGSVLDGNCEPAAPFGLSTESINRHVFVSGATGAGKSETVRSLLWSLDRRSVPWLVVEPAKAEYAALAPWLQPSNALVVIRPGDPSQPPPMLNPLEPSSISVGGQLVTFPLQTHLDMVRALFTAAFDAEEPFPQVLGAALTRTYERRGWNLVTGATSNLSLAAPQWPVLGDLVRESLSVVDGLGYGKEIRDNVRGFIKVRIESLRSGTPGRFFEGGYPLDLVDLLARPTVFEIEDLGDDRDKAFFIGNVVIRLVELLRLRQKHGLLEPGLSHVLVIEEAHRLLHQAVEGSPAAHAVTQFANLLAEIRAYGEGVVVAEQIPAKVIPDLVKNSAVKLMHRLPAEDDRRAVGATMNLSPEQSAYVVALQPGQAVAHTAGMDRPVLVRMSQVGSRPTTGAGVGTPVLGPRSAACPSDCSGGHHCTLEDIANARDLLGPEVQLWIELVTMAHLAGEPVGKPSGAWINRFASADPERARCAIGLATDVAVGRRAETIRKWYDPDLLAAQVAKMATAQLTTRRGLGRPPRRWRLGRFRYEDIRCLLAEPGPEDDTTFPHPDTPDWVAGGVQLPGPTWQDQAQQAALLDRAEPLIRQSELAGDVDFLVGLARSTGARAPSDAGLLKAMYHRLGLECTWIGRRTGASRG